MSHTDTAVFIAVLAAIAVLLVRYEVESHRRRKDSRDMWRALQRSASAADWDSGGDRRGTVNINRKHGMTHGAKIAVLLLGIIGTASAQVWEPPKPGPLCGQRMSTPETHSITVACVDFDALADLGVPGVYGRQMQVLVIAKGGDAVRVEAFYTDSEGKEASIVRWADLRRDAYGNLAAMPVLDGWEYTRLTITIFNKAGQ